MKFLIIFAFCFINYSFAKNLSYECTSFKKGNTDRHFNSDVMYLKRGGRVQHALSYNKNQALLIEAEEVENGIVAMVSDIKPISNNGISIGNGIVLNQKYKKIYSSALIVLEENIKETMLLLVPKNKGNRFIKCEFNLI